MNSSVDYRHLIIQGLESIYDSKSIHQVIIISLPNEDAVDLDDIQDEITELIHKAGIVGYAIEDKRHTFSGGASSFGQEIIVQLVLSIAGNMIYDFGKLLILWIKGKIKRESARVYLDKKEIIETIVRTINEYFLPTGSLKVESIKMGKFKNTVNIVDEASNKYMGEMSYDGAILKINKIIMDS